MKGTIRSILRRLSGNAIFRNVVQPFTKCGLVPHEIYRRFPIEGEFQTPVNDNAGFVYCSSYEDSVGRALFWRGAGGFEPETFEYIAPLLKKAKVFADIGANTGHFTLYACAINPDLFVHAFEPVPRNFEHLKQNVERNGWNGRCHVHQQAVGEEDGKVSFHIPHETLPTSASLNLAGFNNLPGALVQTDIVRLDSVFKQDVPDVLKIDVEGYEHLVLRGLDNIFKAGHRPHIIFECHPDGPAQEIMNVLDPLGYHYCHLSRSGPVEFKKITPEHVKKDWNWAAIPPTSA